VFPIVSHLRTRTLAAHFRSVPPYRRRVTQVPRYAIRIVTATPGSRISPQWRAVDEFSRTMQLLKSTGADRASILFFEQQNQYIVYSERSNDSSLRSTNREPTSHRDQNATGRPQDSLKRRPSWTATDRPKSRLQASTEMQKRARKLNANAKTRQLLQGSDQAAENTEHVRRLEE